MSYEEALTQSQIDSLDGAGGRPSPVGNLARDLLLGTRLDQLATAAAFDPREVADPGDAGAIPVDASAFVPLVTEGAETRTVADPERAGLRLSLFFLTDGGDCVITFASAFNAAGNNTLTHDTAGELVVFESVRDGDDTFRWALVANPEATGVSTV